MGFTAYGHSLLEHNTFGMEVKADCFFEYGSEEELRGALPHLERPLLNIGRGSNMLFCGDFHGTVLHSAIDGAEIVSTEGDAALVRAGSGYVWDGFVEWCISHGLYGAENLSGIPGEVGAAAVQNIGAYGAEVCRLIREVRTVDAESGEIRVFTADECGYAYRDSIFKRPENKRYIVTSVLLCLSRTWRPDLAYKALSQAFEGRTPTAAEVRQEVIAMRDSKLPESAGQRRQFLRQPGGPRIKGRPALFPLPRNAAIYRRRGLRKTLRRLADRQGRMEGAETRQGRSL